MEAAAASGNGQYTWFFGSLLIILVSGSAAKECLLQKSVTQDFTEDLFSLSELSKRSST